MREHLDNGLPSLRATTFPFLRKEFPRCHFCQQTLMPCHRGTAQSSVTLVTVAPHSHRSLMPCHRGTAQSSVTLFGESAGATSVSTHMAMPSSFGLFRRVILDR